jgi:hypothetical protein
MTIQNQYRVEVYDLNSRDAWNVGVYSNKREQNFNQNMMDWTLRTFKVAISDAQSAFWIYGVGVTQVKNGETIQLRDDRTNKLVIAQHSPNAEFAVTVRLDLSKWLRESATYKAFEKVRSDLNRQIEVSSRDMQLQSIVQKYNTRLASWNVGATTVNNMSSSAYVNHRLSFQLGLKLNDEHMHAFLTKQFVGAHDWDVHQRLLDCEAQFLQRIKRIPVDYQGHAPTIQLDITEMNRLLHDVDMPYDVTKLDELHGRQGDGVDLEYSIQEKLEEITKKIQVNTKEITDITTQFYDEIKVELENRERKDAEIEREKSKYFLTLVEMYVKNGYNPTQAFEEAKKTLGDTYQPPSLPASFSPALPDNASKNNVNDAD